MEVGAARGMSSVQEGEEEEEEERYGFAYT